MSATESLPIDRNGGPLLSIVIASMNRPAALSSAVRRLLKLSEGLSVEVVVADASPVGQQLELDDPRLNVIHLKGPGGVDADYDCAVRRATGLYCWFFTDDDVVDDDAVGAVVRILERTTPAETSLVLVDVRVADPRGNQLQASLLPSAAPRSLAAGVAAEAFAPLAPLLTYIGSVVIDRSLWLARASDAFVGSEFRHVGLVLSAPLPGKTVVLASPAATVVYGVAHWESRALEVWTTKWPTLIRSSVSSTAAWPLFYPAGVFRQAVFLLDFRARGLLTRANVQSCYPFEKTSRQRLAHTIVAALPRRFARALCAVKVRLRAGESRMLQFDLRRS